MISLWGLGLIAIAMPRREAKLAWRVWRRLTRKTNASRSGFKCLLMFAPQAVIHAQRPCLEVGEDAMDARQNEMAVPSLTG